jgi:magnesium chelatase family protein
MKKRGTHYDLAMALGLLVEDEQVMSTRIESCVFFGELSLNGNLRRCKGILPMIIAAKQAGYSNIILPKENLQEEALIEGLCIMGFSTLKEVVAFMEGNGELESYSSGGEVQPIKEVNGLSCDFSEVLGQQNVVEKAMIAAAGGHNILLIGEPGCGKSMIAKRIPTILPRMSKREALEVTKIYSVAGLLSDQGNLITNRPFRSPHHNASLSALIGGGRNAMPGEISLAHNGGLFLDEMVEFSRKTIESLR